VTVLAEGPITKGGHNPPNLSTARPPAPGGSGGGDYRPPVLPETYQALQWMIKYGTPEDWPRQAPPCPTPPPIQSLCESCSKPWKTCRCSEWYAGALGFIAGLAFAAGVVGIFAIKWLVGE
jgi:hypothetical protein